MPGTALWSWVMVDNEADQLRQTHLSTKTRAVDAGGVSPESTSRKLRSIKI